jgi:hypothetical protein
MLSDRLTTREADHTKAAIDELRSVPWAQPLLARLSAAGGLRSENMPLLFEVRFACELHRSGGTAEYEYAAGVGNSTIEFRIPGSPSWLVELVSVRKSDAMRRATTTSGIVTILSPDAASDMSQSEAAELITAEQKIAEKVFAKGKPTKFPAPADHIHMILVDIRGYLDAGGDRLDWLEIAAGTASIPPSRHMAIHYWTGRDGKARPVLGLYEKNNPIEGARYIQERIHVIGFVREQKYVPREIQDSAFYVPNPYLFATNDGVGRSRLSGRPLCATNSRLTKC